MRKITTFVKNGIHLPDYKHASAAGTVKGLEDLFHLPSGMKTKTIDIEEVDHYKESAYIPDFFDWRKAEPSQATANGASHGRVMEMYG